MVNETKTSSYSKTYLVVNEVLNAVTHGIGVILSIIGLVFLIQKGIDVGGALEVTSYTIYGTSLILLYLSSTLYHSFTFTRAKKVFRVIDHSSIFVLIAGTYTPYTLITIGGKLGAFLTTLIWSIALFGVLYKTVWFEKFQGLSLWLYIAMGWISLFFINYLYRGLGPNGFIWLIAGGLAFTVGALFYRLKHVKYMHVVWHLFVLTGTIFMFFSIYLYT
ncbi:MAG: PAQR family membrane homeostasis protein TrhA [Alkalibacterium gilvum]|uniref:Hemolysin III n=1 Tax=Alkalibacterium gilvum TaxID=1130080 RepID=A0A1H6R2B3_9LACT|nr:MULTISPECIES: hemolysin III family protein [Alkalibacterium]MDN6392141.1 hemolysin III family protein [Lactococcus lactis]MDN6293663.1 hemolysin III family protein [Alkalibacterium sp.]MDN6295292.1 hemolysin III family protein [Alkalibacterium sp.]MDN6729141.1 hemolysin III family protein [Alkalibacterium sp.]SEI49941.1 hemolysin III [Alkalibacterium gilvum]